MIIIPEIQIVVILVPRTGTKSLKEAITRRYPGAMHLYRHMEVDGIPSGYNRWTKVGVVRDPAERLWSAYKYLRTFGLPPNDSARFSPDFTARQRHSVNRPFCDWILNNETIWITGSSKHRGASGDYPYYSVLNPIPENRKSQMVYLRPDKGTLIFKYTCVDKLYSLLDVSPVITNSTDGEPMPTLTKQCLDYLLMKFRWDHEMCPPQGREWWRDEA